VPAVGAIVLEHLWTVVSLKGEIETRDDAFAECRVAQAAHAKRRARYADGDKLFVAQGA